MQTDAKHGVRRGVAMLRRLLEPASRTRHSSWILSLIGRGLAAEGAFVEGLSVAQKAYSGAEQLEIKGERERMAANVATVLLRAGRVQEALDTIPDVQNDTPMFEADVSLIRVEALIAAGQMAQGQVLLERVKQDIETFSLTYMEPRAAALSDTLFYLSTT